MRIQLIRHATSILTIGSYKIIIDPVFSKKGTLPPIPNVLCLCKNPLAELPEGFDRHQPFDAVLSTHMHSDHFDNEAINAINQNTPVICQTEDQATLKGHNFVNIIPVGSSIVWNGISITRTKARHGHGIIADKMAPSSGYIINAPEEKRLYITGDTVWFKEIPDIINTFKPDIILAYCGAARFAAGQPITMNAADINRLCGEAPHAKIIAIHMDAWNHCRLTRNKLSAYTAKNGLQRRVLIPSDGETLDI